MYLMNSDGTNIRPLAGSVEVRSAASWSPDGKRVAVSASENERAHVLLVPVDGGPSVRLLDTPSYNPVWSQDGQLIVYSQPVRGSQMVLRAITPNKRPVPIPEIVVPYTASAPYRFVPGRRELIFMEDAASVPTLGAGPRNYNFYWIDLITGQERRLTDLKPGYLTQSFDISPDGKQIIFDRLRDNSNLVLMDLGR